MRSWFCIVLVALAAGVCGMSVCAGETTEWTPARYSGKGLIRSWSRWKLK